MFNSNFYTINPIIVNLLSLLPVPIAATAFCCLPPDAAAVLSNIAITAATPLVAVPPAPAPS